MVIGGVCYRPSADRRVVEASVTAMRREQNDATFI